jgi:hypothetical protein
MIFISNIISNNQANYLLQHASEFGIQYIAWNRMAFSPSSNQFKAFSGPNPHIDHIHMELNIEASRRTKFGGSDDRPNSSATDGTVFYPGQ